MKIDKAKMAIAWSRRSEPEYMDELLGYFDQMGKHFSNHFKIKYQDRDDYAQEAKIRAFKSLDLYDPDRGSNPFSYFYK